MNNGISSLKEFFPEVINLMPSTFSSHEFIQVLSHKHQALYINSLSYYCDKSSEPFTTVHQLIGKELLSFPQLIMKIGEEKSKNIFGHVVECSKWQKHSPND